MLTGSVYVKCVICGLKYIHGHLVSCSCVYVLYVLYGVGEVGFLSFLSELFWVVCYTHGNTYVHSTLATLQVRMKERKATQTNKTYSSQTTYIAHGTKLHR